MCLPPPSQNGSWSLPVAAHACHRPELFLSRFCTAQTIFRLSVCSKACLSAARYVYDFVGLQSDLDGCIDIQNGQLQPHARFCDVREELPSAPVDPNMPLIVHTSSTASPYYFLEVIVNSVLAYPCASPLLTSGTEWRAYFRKRAMKIPPSTKYSDALKDGTLGGCGGTVPAFRA